MTEVPSQEVKIQIDQQYKETYQMLQEAERLGDRVVYIKGLNRLGSLMGDEVDKYHRSGYGDLHHSFTEWNNQLFRNWLNDQSNRDKVARGENVEFRSDTLTNQRAPHPKYPDTTSEVVSGQMSGAIVGYVNGRGQGYFSARTVIGEGKQQFNLPSLPHSARQTLTVVKGFGKSI